MKIGSHAGNREKVRAEHCLMSSEKWFWRKEGLIHVLKYY
jgi:hypothetical protein